MIEMCVEIEGLALPSKMWKYLKRKGFKKESTLGSVPSENVHYYIAALEKGVASDVIFKLIGDYELELKIEQLTMESINIEISKWLFM